MRSTWRHHRRGPGSPAAGRRRGRLDLVVGGVRGRGGQPRPATSAAGPPPGGAARRARACSSGVSDGSTRHPVASTAPSARHHSVDIWRAGSALRVAPAATGARRPAAAGAAPARRTTMTTSDPVDRSRAPSSEPGRSRGRSAARLGRPRDWSSGIGRRSSVAARRRIAAALTAVAGVRARAPTRPAAGAHAGVASAPGSPRPGVGSNGTQPRPSNQTSGQAWAFLPSTVRGCRRPAPARREADGDAGRDAERAGHRRERAGELLAVADALAQERLDGARCCGPGGRRGCTELGPEPVLQRHHLVVGRRRAGRDGDGRGR